MENRAKYKTSFVKKNTDLPYYTETYYYPEASHGGPHSHEFFEIGIVLEGYGEHHVNQQKIPLQPGSTYLIPIGTVHSLDTFDFSPMSTASEYTSVGGSMDKCAFSIQNLYILPKILPENLGMPMDAYSIFMDFFLNCIIQNQEHPIHLQLESAQLDAVKHLIHLCQNPPQMLPSLLQAYQKNIFNNLLLLLCEAWIRPSVARKEGTITRNIKILYLIYENIHQPISDIIELLAKRLQLNSQYLNRLVKQSFHTTLSQLILETKLEKSCQLLAMGSSVTEISLSLAFYDHSHYTRYFTRYFGISPSEYKKRHGSAYSLNSPAHFSNEIYPHHKEKP